MFDKILKDKNIKNNRKKIKNMIVYIKRQNIKMKNIINSIINKDCIEDFGCIELIQYILNLKRTGVKKQQKLIQSI